jgi:hypothetical protein
MTPDTSKIGWTELSKSDEVLFSPQIKAGFNWLLNLLDETERTRKIRRSIYDQPIKERLRRAS